MTAATVMAAVSVAAMTNMIGRISGNIVIVTNIEEYVSSATNEVHEAVREVDEATKGVQERSWYTKDDWCIRWSQSPDAIEDTFVSVDTNDAGQVFRSTLVGASWPLRVRLSAEMVDIYSMNPVGDVVFTTSDAGASISNGWLLVTAPGMYSVTATSPNGTTRVASVPVWARVREGVLSMTYDSDVAVGSSIVKAVNDEFLSDLQALTTDGEEYDYYDGVQGTFKKWTFGGGVRNPCRPRTYRWWSFTPVSPHVLVFAAHCPWIKWGTSPNLTFDGSSGPVTVTVDGTTLVNLHQWAVDRGIDGALADMTSRDLVVASVKDGSPTIPVECCPRFITQDKVTGLLGSRNEKSHGSVMIWMSSQNYDNNTQFVPAVLVDTSDRLVVSSAGFDSLAGVINQHWYGSSVLYENYFDGGFRIYTPGIRKDIRAYFDSHGTNAEYWKFPKLYVGDSGGASFMKYNGDFILLGTTTYASGGGADLCGTAAVEFLRRFCAQFGDTLKEVD